MKYRWDDWQWAHAIVMVLSKADFYYDFRQNRPGKIRAYMSLFICWIKEDGDVDGLPEVLLNRIIINND